jgi:ABC-type polar amino acid transport system ATPase subunit/ABC-type transporter Mla maintaining outer membrane lipid asymmetry permease subunit MlaE
VSDNSNPTVPQVLPPSSGVAVVLDNVGMQAGGLALLNNVSTTFPAGKVSVVIGPSGVGKSLLLKRIAGLLDEDESAVSVSGGVKLKQISESNARPRVGVVFQQFALFDELSPQANVRLAASQSRGRTTRKQADQLLVDLGVPTDRKTALLSGGQRQRLAVARTLASGVDVILYDEPTSGLDAAASQQVAQLIRSTNEKLSQTAVVVTHDVDIIPTVADHVFFFDAAAQNLIEVPREDWPSVRQRLLDTTIPERPASGVSWGQKTLHVTGTVFAKTARLAESIVQAPVALLPLWKNPVWGLRFFLHYARLVAGPSSWVYLALAGVIIGYVSTYFTFRFLPFSQFTQPLLVENLLGAMGFALYRILVPVLATILIAARCSAAVSADIGGKSYGGQLAAMHTLGMKPRAYLFTPILWAFLLGTPLLVGIAYVFAAITSLVVFTFTESGYGPDFWNLHFHRELTEDGLGWFVGTRWLLAKTLLCGFVSTVVTYHLSRRPKHSTADVSRTITSVILWTTLLVLFVHFGFAFVEFE